MKTPTNSHHPHHCHSGPMPSSNFIKYLNQRPSSLFYYSLQSIPNSGVRMILLNPKSDPKTFNASPSPYLPWRWITFMTSSDTCFLLAHSSLASLAFLTRCESTKCRLLRTFPFSLPWKMWLLPSLCFLLCSNVTFSMKPYWLPIQNCTHMSYHFLYHHMPCFSPFFYYHLTSYLFFFPLFFNSF